MMTCKNYNYINECYSFQNGIISDLNFSSVMESLQEYIYNDDVDNALISRISGSSDLCLNSPSLISNSKPNRDTIYVVTGAIGCGKSVFARELYHRGIISPAIEFVCEDLYKKCFFDNIYPLKSAYIKAKQFFNHKILKKITMNKGFLIEFVPSSVYRLNLLDRLRSLGYRICIFHLMTRDALINIDRVKMRIENGGDIVDLEKVRSRYRIVNKNLKTILNVTDEIYIFDSRENNFVFVAYGDREELKVIDQCDYIINYLYNTGIKIYRD